MNKRILIVHQGSIVAEGLLQIIKTSPLKLHDHVRVFEDPANINIQANNNYIFICTAATFSKIERMNLLETQNIQHRYIQLFINQNTLKSEKTIASIMLDDSSIKIIEAVKQAIQSLSEEKSLNSSLTEREIEILKLVALGNASKEIADRLNISTHTVVTHRKNITEKLGIKSISGLTVYAILNKIINTNELSIDDLI